MDGSVRRCRACGQAAMVGVRAWDESLSVYGVPLGTTEGGGGTELVCQGCGVAFTLRPPSWTDFLWLPLAAMFVLSGVGFAIVAAALLEPVLVGASLFALGFGAVLLRESAWPMWVRWRNPIVAGAPFPELKFLALEPRRRCSCGATARCTQVTVNRTSGIYTGTDYAFVCDTCEHTFAIESPLGAAGTVLVGVVLLGIGFAAVPWAGEKGSWACAGLMAALGLFMLGMAASGLLARIRHPIVVVPR